MKKIMIGKRNIKTAISVFIASLLYVFLFMLDKYIGKETETFEGLTALYTPFFGAIAAAYTSHRDFKSSLKQARIRSLGSIIGGYFGMVLILLFEFLFKDLLPLNNEILYYLIQYSTVGLGIIPLIYLAVKFKQTDATFISCLTYLSVTISVRNGGMGIAEFATNRIISTLIGVGIALLVNNFRIHYKKNKNVLFIAGIDAGIDYSDYPLSFTRYKINDLYQRNANLILHTKNSGLDSKLFNEVNVNKSLILMDGVCIYDASSKNYIYSCDFIPDIKVKLNNYLYNKKYDVFTYVFHEFRLVCHYKNITNEASKAYFEKEKSFDNYPFAYADILDSCDVGMYVMFIKNDMVDNFLKDLKELELYDYLKITFKNTIDENFTKIRIKPLYSNRYDTIKHLPYYEECDIKIAFLYHLNDLTGINDFDFKICFDNSIEEIKKVSDYIIKSNDFNDVLKLFDKFYYAKNIEKYINKLKKKKS